jgi:BirA family transcriptional regulator, biotin operon repressor / biotin---[acetyl-CoA-carboxylase] ligase
MGEDEIFFRYFMRIIGRKIIRLEETDSTNLYAERLLETGDAADGTIITAKFQTAGKGQGDNTWESERGKNLLATVILKPFFLRAGEQFLLNKVVTLAVCDMLRSAGIDPSVKWPNDIYAESKKIAGLLISHRVSGSSLEFTMAGIGINLNQEHFPGTLPDAVSLKIQTGVEQDPDKMLEMLAVRLDFRYDMLRQGSIRQIGSDYLLQLRGFEKWMKYTADESAFEGKILGVDEFGRLILELRDGTTKLFSHGEISVPASSF